MPARNADHEIVKSALIADGWTITDDPLRIPIGNRNIFIDLGLESPPIGAVKGERRIAIEVQSFLGQSQMTDFHHAVGQYLVYRSVLNAAGENRTLYLAVPQEAMLRIWMEPIGLAVRTDYNVELIAFTTDPPGSLQWIGHRDIAIS